MSPAKWIAHFARNRQNRPEPDWSAPITLTPEVLAPLIRSLEQFRLGDGGGPASLIAHDADVSLCRTVELTTGRRRPPYERRKQLIAPSGRRRFEIA